MQEQQHFTEVKGRAHLKQGISPLAIEFFDKIPQLKECLTFSNEWGAQAPCKEGRKKNKIAREWVQFKGVEAGIGLAVAWQDRQHAVEKIRKVWNRAEIHEGSPGGISLEAQEDARKGADWLCSSAGGNRTVEGHREEIHRHWRDSAQSSPGISQKRTSLEIDEPPPGLYRTQKGTYSST